jgi:molybdate transport repressor ModE-like protein
MEASLPDISLKCVKSGSNWFEGWIMKFDETDLDLFCHIAEAGSITHGATRANMALTAASARIRNMETPLGVLLLERKRYGVALSPAGRIMLTHARQMLPRPIGFVRRSACSRMA